jgi:hypothetical protein
VCSAANERGHELHLIIIESPPLFVKIVAQRNKKQRVGNVEVAVFQKHFLLHSLALLAPVRARLVEYFIRNQPNATARNFVCDEGNCEL